jgi:hypothetical protein
MKMDLQNAGWGGGPGMDCSGSGRAREQAVVNAVMNPQVP